MELVNAACGPSSASASSFGSSMANSRVLTGARPEPESFGDVAVCPVTVKISPTELRSPRGPVQLLDFRESLHVLPVLLKKTGGG